MAIDTPDDLEDDDLLPARMINEAVYCRRLFWLEHVAGEWRESHDTVDGSHVHRRVDRPSRRSRDLEVDDAPVAARSVSVSSKRLGVVAKIDVLELVGDDATPIDFKRGSVPNIPAGAYDPERVQVCLQGLLLREAGYRSDAGELYFAESRRRVRIEFTDALIAQTLAAIDDARSLIDLTSIPAPLVDSPKCGRCSLAPICMPDETNTLHAASSAPVRPLVPTADDALPLYVVTQGARLGLTGEVLEVRKDDEVLDRARLIEIAHVSLFGNVSVSAPLVRALVERGIVVMYFTYGGWLSAIVNAPIMRSLDVRMAQHRVASDDAAALVIAREIIEGKVRNQRTMLRRALGSERRSELQELSWCIDRAKRAANRDVLLGYEGNAARVYFGSFSSFLKSDDARFDFAGRNRRPPRDRINALLSFAYALLVKECVAALLSVGLEPGLGVYHQFRPGRPGLALDLAEEFRPLIADSVVINALNVREIEPSHFIELTNEVALTAAGRRAFIGAFERRMSTEVVHPTFGYRISYRRILYVQARMLARALEGDLPRYTAFITR